MQRSAVTESVLLTDALHAVKLNSAQWVGCCRVSKLYKCLMYCYAHMWWRYCRLMLAMMVNRFCTMCCSTVPVDMQAVEQTIAIHRRVFP